MRFFKWLFGPEKKEKNEKHEKMPDFKNIFLSLPNVIKTTIIPTDAAKTDEMSFARKRDAAKQAAESEAKAANSRYKIAEVHTRIQTAVRRKKEIVWLLQTDKETPHESIGELLKSFRSMKSSDSFRGMSVSYDCNGELHEISPLTEQDAEGLARKLEMGKRADGSGKDDR